MSFGGFTFVEKGASIMWKKSEPEEPQPQPAPAPMPQPATAPKVSVPQIKEQAVIGSTISIKGDLTGEEDLSIEGRLEGKIELRRHSVTVGKNGRIKGDIYGRVITVEGTVEGNLYGEEQLVVRQSGTVRGNIVAPRVALEDGSNFKGSIDMSPKEKSAATPAPALDRPLIVAKTT
jgi:cytoskeletal protein CcmA (bactofilin family)